MKTVGIITTFRQANWGSVLQAYSLQKVVDSMGYKSTLIDYIYPNSYHYKQGCPIHKRKNINYIKEVIKRVLIFLRVYKRKMTKMELLDTFIAQNMSCTKRITTRDDLKKFLPHFDIYLSGSDQIWNPNTMYGDMSYMFDFAPDESKRIAYASSFSCSNIPCKYETLYKKYLSKFSAISVREKNGIILARKYSSLDNIQLVLDPTLLINRDEWSHIGENHRNLKIPNDYILLYMLAYTYSPDHKMSEILSYVQNKYKYPIISLSPKPYDFKGNFYQITSNEQIGISEFIFLFEKSKIVVTSSFHGTAFSVNFGKPFIALEDGISQSDDRISTLIKTLGLSKNLINTEDSLSDEIEPFYDVEEEQRILQINRNKSLMFLKRSLEE